VPVDSIAGLERANQRLILSKLQLARLDALIGNGPVDIFADRLHIFGLEIGGLDHFRVWREPGKGAIERGARHAGALGGRPEAFHTGLGVAGSSHRGKRQGEQGCRYSN
jgi:hypothetical protein